jgi:peptide/nickel transport system substrate-binding protein
VEHREIDRHFSRRELLYVLGLVGMAPAASALLGACAPSAPQTGGVAQPQAPQTPSAPRVGGEVRIDITGEPSSLDPLRFNATANIQVYRLITSQLLNYKADKSFEPDLAASLPTVSADGLTYTIKLKTGVKWHDGKPFDSADVKFTYDAVLDPQNASVWRSGWLFVDSVEAPDPTTVVVRLKSRFTPMPHLFALTPIISSKIQPYEQNKTYATTLIGTGPFKFVEWQRGTQVVLERNPEYFIQGKPYLNRVIFRNVPDNAARVTNIANGTSQILPFPPLNQLDLLRSRGVNVAVLPESTVRVFAYPSFAPGRPTNDVNLRLAIAWAIDRQAIIEQVYAGTAVPAATYLSSGSQYFDEKLGTFFGSKPDLAKAREYLAKSNYPPGREFIIAYQNVPDIADVATIVQANLRAIGLTSRLSPVDLPAIVQLLQSGEYDIFLLFASAQVSSGYSPHYVYLGYLSGGVSNFNSYSDPVMDDLLRRAVAAPENEAAAAWRAVQERDLQNPGQLQIVTARYVEAYGKSLQNYQPSALLYQKGLVDAWIG